MITTRKLANATARFNKRLATDRQADVLEVVIKLRERLRRTPSIREIAGECQIRTSAVATHLQALRRKRYIDWEPNSSRSLVVAKGIPLLGEVG